MTSDLAYWLGAIASDGNLTLQRTSKLVQFGSNDHDWVQMFKEFFSVRTKTCFSGKSASVRFSSAELFDLAMAHGITEAKSKILEVSSELAKSRDFWRGVIDGDGSLTSKQYPAISLGTASYDFAVQFAIFSHNPTVSHWKSREFYQVGFGGSKAVALVRELYNQANTAMPRKLLLAKRIMG